MAKALWQADHKNAYRPSHLSRHRIVLAVSITSGRLHFCYFYPVHNTKKNTSASPAELHRARCGSGGTGLGPLTLPAAHAATRPTKSRVGLHEDGRLAVIVHEAPERHIARSFISLPEKTLDDRRPH